ncbi:MAG: hypothetical protein EXS16_08835 [Gemmataceae bacterium]|nr:hypothetical protein [Gemmataceae bacterium]
MSLSWRFGLQGFHVVFLGQREEFAKRVVVAADADAVSGEDGGDFDLGVVGFEIVVEAGFVECGFGTFDEKYTFFAVVLVAFGVDDFDFDRFEFDGTDRGFFFVLGGDIGFDGVGGAGSFASAIA